MLGKVNSISDGRCDGAPEKSGRGKVLRSSREREPSRWDWTEQEEVPLGTRLGFLLRELVDWFPHSSAPLSGLLGTWRSISARLFSLFIHNQSAFLDLHHVCGSQTCPSFPKNLPPIGWDRSLHQAALQRANSRSVGCAARLDHLAERWRPGGGLGRRGVAVAAFIGLPRRLLY